MSKSDAVTVSQLNHYIAEKLKDDSNLSHVTVSGEISNFVNHIKSGHFYFTLKDSSASIKCVMFRADTLKLKEIPENGQQVNIRGRIQVFERDGIYQLYAENIEAAGMGNLFEEFEKLKIKLYEKGYFEQKRPIPQIPSKICIITAKTGAALQDMLSILERRYPFAEVTLISALVQGKDAPMSLIKAFSLAGSTDADVIIFGRGGGSIEDLWAFNDEKLAYTIFNSRIPTISAVGHETDFTIADFVADLRAPTPSAAAELAVPDMSDLKERLTEFHKNLASLAKHRLEEKYKSLLGIMNEINLKSPKIRLKTETERLLLLENHIKINAKSLFQRKSLALKGIAETITALSPVHVLMRGFARAFDGNNNVVKSAESVDIGDVLSLRLHNGKLSVEVIEKETK